MQWLASNGISESRIEISKSLSWIRFNSTIGEAEMLIKTKYNVRNIILRKECEAKSSQVYEHPNTKKPHVACEEYSLPIEIKEHIDFITPTISFDAYLTNPEKSNPKAKRGDGSQPMQAPSLQKRDGAGGQPLDGPKPGPGVDSSNTTYHKGGAIAGPPL